MFRPSSQRVLILQEKENRLESTNFCISDYTVVSNSYYNKPNLKVPFVFEWRMPQSIRTLIWSAFSRVANNWMKFEMQEFREWKKSSHFTGRYLFYRQLATKISYVAVFRDIVANAFAISSIVNYLTAPKGPLMRENWNDRIPFEVSDIRWMTSQFVCGRFGKFILLSQGTRRRTPIP